MGWFGSSNDEERDAERTRLATELAGLKGEVHALRTERDRTAEMFALQESIEKLKLEKGRLTEDHRREIRETEHKVGLLKTKQDQDVAHATRQAKLEVRETNLAADKDRFAAEMKFQREHLQREVGRLESILGQVLERLPNVDAQLTGRLTPRKGAE